MKKEKETAVEVIGKIDEAYLDPEGRLAFWVSKENKDTSTCLRRIRNGLINVDVSIYIVAREKVT